MGIDPVTGALISAGIGVGTDMLLSKDDDVTQTRYDPQISDYTKTMADIARGLHEQTQPMRSAIIGRGEQFLGPEGFDVSASPMWSPSRNVLEDQYNVARENVISNMPKGGQLFTNLRDLEESRAQGLGDLASRIAMDEYNKMFGFSTQAPGQALTGLGGAGGILSQLAGQQINAQMQQQAGKARMLGDMGQGIGTILASK